ncbi:MAG: VWA domain-containing protein [Gammaproteobacteria bacterium]|nr:VWA domain-containing protein [Gammaproteobacteria bacterium]
MLTLAAPHWLLALPLIITVLWLSSRLSTQRPLRLPSLLHPQTRLLATLVTADHNRTARWPWWLGIALLCLALTRPLWIIGPTASGHPAHNIMLAIDVSGSMRTLDYQHDRQAISRLDMLKQQLPGFIARRAGDRIGIIAFADDAVTYVPLTTDHALLTGLLADLQQGLAGERTALGDAIALASHRLQHVDTSRILILLTDGANTAGRLSPLQALELCRQHHVRIYTVALGTAGKVAFPRGPVLPPLTTALPPDTALLQQIAASCGGRFFHITAQHTLDQAFAEIDHLEPGRVTDPSAARHHELFWLPLSSALLLLLWSEWRSRHQVLPC